MNQDLSNLLCSYDPITLMEMENVKLLDRIDTKFMFSSDRLEIILSDLQKYYKVLDVNGIKQNKYETLYFDTHDFKLYRDHHNGRTNRYKVRCRKYVDSNLVFFEIKHKNNKGRTIKSRVQLEKIDPLIEGKATALLNEKTPFGAECLESKFWVNYSRITLVNKTTTERLTLDLNLQFKDEENSVLYQNLVIAEVKQAKLGNSPFRDLMKSSHIRESSISKYCFGVIALIADIKKNNFKSNLLTINKLSYDAII